MSAIICLNGVMKTPSGDPIQDGIKLFRVMSGAYRIALSSEDNPKETEHWLKTNFIFDYGAVYDSSHFYLDQPLALRHVELSRGDSKPELFVSADPELCSQVLAMGIPTILFSSPKYFPSYRRIKPWNVITEEQIRQKRIVSEKYSDYVNNDGKRWE